MKITIVYNKKKQANAFLVQELSAYIQSRGGELIQLGSKCGLVVGDLPKCDFSDCNVAIALGGDGTMLAVTRHMAKYGIPVLGVNAGNVGFLSAVESDEALAAIDLLLAGEYSVQQRLMLRASLKRDGHIVTQCSALNEIAVSSGVNSRAVTLDLTINGDPVNSYNTDRIIVASPTGCTGYSLSAGGPLIMEDLAVMLITPICSHSFFSRPIVVSGDSEVEIISRSGSNAATIMADGQFRFSLEKNDKITVNRTDYPARIIRFAGESYFERIKNKLYV